MSLKDKIDFSRVPSHVAIIMDGNGRWAQKQGLERYFGHQEGTVSVRKVVEVAGEIGIKYLTLYTFSTENWKRPQEEVDALMDLVVTTLMREIPDLMKNGVRLGVIGDIERLPSYTRESLNDCMEQTSNNTGLNLVLALSYSSRWEITNAVREITSKIIGGALDLEDIDENLITENLNTAGIPDPELLIRTGGEYRISNFLMWQLSYTELYFTELYWPDFREEEFYEAIISYQLRERRFGKTGDQIK